MMCGWTLYGLHPIGSGYGRERRTIRPLFSRYSPIERAGRLPEDRRIVIPRRRKRPSPSHRGKAARPGSGATPLFVSEPLPSDMSATLLEERRGRAATKAPRGRQDGAATTTQILIGSSAGRFSTAS